MINILFIATHRPDRAPGQRFRFEQILPHLKEHDINYTFSYLFNESDDKVFYSNGKLLSKAFILLKSVVHRTKDVLAAKNYDIIFIQRECMIFGPPLFERLLITSGAKIIFDFDDSIWISNVSQFNKYFGWLKFSQKTKKIIGMADLIVAGNAFLAEYASKYNSNVTVIPTTIDTEKYAPVNPEKYLAEKICIGWSGSETTLQHFKILEPVLKRLYDKYYDKIYFKVIGSGSYFNDELNIEGLAWNKNAELEDLAEIEIGVMPLPDNNWARGKCGLKGLQYMALGIATIMSPVGVNTDIITDGVNGFLAVNEQEWFDKLSMLIEDRHLSKQVGLKGRQMVVQHYSIDANLHKYLNVFNAITKTNE